MLRRDIVGSADVSSKACRLLVTIQTCRLITTTAQTMSWWIAASFAVISQPMVLGSALAPSVTAGFTTTQEETIAVLYGTATQPTAPFAEMVVVIYQTPGLSVEPMAETTTTASSRTICLPTTTKSFTSLRASATALSWVAIPAPET